MTKKKKLGILATALSLVVCVVLGGLLWWEMTKPERIEIPVPGLSWGMSAAEVEAVLADAGLENAKVGGIMTQSADVEIGGISLTAEEMQKLGVTEILGLPITSQKRECVWLRFVESYGSTKYDAASGDAMRLVQVEFWIEVPEGTSLEVNKQVNAALDKAYGKPDGPPGYWEIVGDEVKNIKVNGNSYGSYYSPDVHFSQKDCGVGEAVVVYCGAGYVEYLYGGFYAVPNHWR